MHFGDLKHILDITISRDDLSGEYGNWINQALRSIQHDQNWNCMRHQAEVVIPNGVMSTTLPADFKELTPARPPIFMQATQFGNDEIDGETARWFPCEITRQEELLRRDAALLFPRRLLTLSHRGPDIYLTSDGTTTAINIIDILGQDATFKVSYFRYLPDLAKDSDRNYLTEHYEEMVKNKVKAVAFEEIVDPIAANYEQLYEIKKKKALRSDAAKWITGRTLRMGG